MSHQKKKTFKDEINQPIIKTFVLPTEEKIILSSEINSQSEQRPRSQSLKRKGNHTPTSEEKKKQDKKRLITPSPPSDISDEMASPKLPGEAKSELTLEAVKKLLEPMNERINKILTEQTKTNDTIGSAALLKEENEKLKQRMSKIEETNKLLQQRINNLENRILGSNIILTGIYEGAWETEEARRGVLYEVIANTIIGRTFEEKLETAKMMYIKNTHRIGKYRQMQNRPIAVEFQYNEDAEYILQNRKYLPPGVYVDKEYSKETEERRKILRPYLNAVRKLPKYQRRCKLEYDKLIIKGISYGTEDLNNLPEDLHGKNISSKTDKHTYGFFGKLHPFSNFYQTEFTFQGHRYHSSEQVIQHLKSDYFEDEEVTNRILNSETALECKHLSREISNFNSDGWNSIAKEMSRGGIRAKFIQNDDLRDLLISTEGKTLVECSTDMVWGNGIKLQDERVLQEYRWAGQGILGEILEEIRDELIRNKNQNREEENVQENSTENEDMVTEITTETIPTAEANGGL